MPVGGIDLSSARCSYMRCHHTWIIPTSWATSISQGASINHDQLHTNFHSKDVFPIRSSFLRAWLLLDCLIGEVNYYHYMYLIRQSWLWYVWAPRWHCFYVDSKCIGNTLGSGITRLSLGSNFASWIKWPYYYQLPWLGWLLFWILGRW